MKRLLTNAISATNAFAPNAATLDFLQDQTMEAINGLLSAILPNPAADTVYILSGCHNTGSGSNYVLSAGVLYYNGEIFNFAGNSFTCGVTELPFASIVIDESYTNANGVSGSTDFTDAIPRNVHVTRKIQIANSATGSGLPQFNNFKAVGAAWLPGEVKEIAVTSLSSTAFLNANFDSTGLGKNNYRGWAIMNGNNGTVNRKGRVSVAYDSIRYPTLGVTGGSEDAVVVAHSHEMTFTTVENDAGSTGTNLNNTQTPAEFTATTSTVGESGIGKNMQPYIITLFIQKLV